MFPSLDNNDSSIYMYAKLDDTSEKLIGVDYTNETINTEFDNATVYKNTSTYYAFNHGNFFMQWEDAGILEVSYLLAESNPNIVQMIIENN